MVDRSPDLAATQSPSSFAVYAQPGDQTGLNHLIYAARAGSQIDVYSARFSDGVRLDFRTASDDPYYNSDALSVLNIPDEFRGAFAIGDLDGDGYADIVAALPGIEVSFWRNGPGPIELVAGGGPFAGITTGGHSADSMLVDLDGDGDLDFVLGINGEGLRFYENTGTAQAAVFTRRTHASHGRR